MNAIVGLLDTYGHLSGRDLIEVMVTQVFPGRIAVVSSFGAESAVLLDLVAQVDPALPVVFVDTGALFDETLSYRYTLQRHLGLTDLRVARPTADEEQAAAGLWRIDPDRCCALRKVAPLDRAVAGFAALIDGRKRAHGFERATLPVLSTVEGVVRISPLAPWSEDDIDDAFRARGLPRHPLAERGYRSIGCVPCTAALTGESPRSGRWAGQAKTECGIHKPRT
ncbi:MAG: phosphoadenylyl-sulfate reductase [Magnetospirillum sp.]|nr:phosphoadenylyl-sulfate reductase [Magnetospirillum sp.]